MKKIIILLIICITYSCETSIKSKTKETTVTTELRKQADIDSVKSLISKSFQAIFSDLDSTAVSKYYTNDFILLENGEVWNNDSIANYIRKGQANKQEYSRLNRFDFLKSVHNENSIWVAYDNYAVFVKEKDTLGKAHWLESAVAIKENNKWKLQLLHSTMVRK